jgi:hypothetical protein
MGRYIRFYKPYLYKLLKISSCGHVVCPTTPQPPQLCFLNHPGSWQCSQACLEWSGAQCSRKVCPSLSFMLGLRQSRKKKKKNGLLKTDMALFEDE